MLGPECPGTTNAVGDLASTYRSLAKFTEAGKLEPQAYEFKERVSGAESSHTITTTANVKEAQKSQVLDAGRIIHGAGHLDSTQVVLNYTVQGVLPDTTKNPQKKGMYLVVVV